MNGITINAKHLKVGIPIAFVAALAGGAMYVQRVDDRISVVEAKEIPEIKEEIKGLRKQLKSLEEGDTPYQRRQEDNIKEIKGLIYDIIRNGRGGAARPGTDR